MSEWKIYDRDETKAIAESLLSDAFGGAVRLETGAALQQRGHVFRYDVVDAPSGAPRSVVVKRAQVVENEHFDPDSERFDDFFNDWAGLQFLNEVADDEWVAPRFYAGDRNIGLFVMEDLGAGAMPSDILLAANASDGEVVLAQMMTALGRIHTLTIGRRAEYDRFRSSLGKHSSNLISQSSVADLKNTAETLGAAFPPEAARAVERVNAVMRDPGPFLAYTHGDPCPDNWLRTRAGLRLYDFEYGGFRHALLDGVYGHIHFPTCWCVNRLPEQVVARMDSAYRAALAQRCPEAADDRLYDRAVVEACAYWTLDATTYIERVLETDREWGISTVRQRVLARIDLFASLTQQHSHLEALGEALSGFARKLRSRWPPEADQMPLYPAFRG